MQQVEELAALIGRLCTSDGIHQTAIPRLALIRSCQPTEPLHALHEPALCIIVQGRKQVMLGSRVYHYDRSQYLVVSVDLPVIGQVIEATPEVPYLCVRLPSCSVRSCWKPAPMSLPPAARAPVWP